MDTLKIDTSQNIDIEQPIASIGERIAAMLLDFLFMLSYIAIFAIIAGGFHYSWMLLVVYLPVVFYSLISELSMNGQSWGKKILKIKVIKMDGTPTSFSSYFLRWIIQLVEVFAFFGSLATITIILNRKGQRLGDIAANTTVIRLRNRNFKGTIFTQIPDNYSVVYPEITKLSTEDIYTIKEVLELLNSTKNQSQTVVILTKTRQVIERKLNIQSNQDTVRFLQTIISDYNFINSRS